MTGSLRRVLPLALLSAGLLVAFPGCGDREEDLAPPDAVYTSRAEVVATPAPGNRSLLLRHESIPDFRSRTGEVDGMDSMTMPFTLARDLSVEGLEEGDAIDFDFEVRWDGDPILRISRLEELPAETTLDFRPLPEEGGTEEITAEEEPSDETEDPVAAPEGTSPSSASEG